MDKKDIRRLATKKFMDNFDQQFTDSLQEAQSKKSNDKPDKTSTNNKKTQPDEEFNLSDLEAAIADIDEYMKTHKKEPPSSDQNQENHI